MGDPGRTSRSAFVFHLLTPLMMRSLLLGFFLARFLLGDALGFLLSGQNGFDLYKNTSSTFVSVMRGNYWVSAQKPALKSRAHLFIFVSLTPHLPCRLRPYHSASQAQELLPASVTSEGALDDDCARHLRAVVTARKEAADILLNSDNRATQDPDALLLECLLERLAHEDLSPRKRKPMQIAS